jgi:hypothetical protein
MQTTLSALLTAAILSSFVSAQCSTLANTPSGTNLLLGDDAVRTVGLGFSFPFAGSQYTTVSVCSNGYVWLGDVAATAFGGLGADYFDNEVDFRTLGPRIALCWDDWNPAGGGAVTFVGNGAQASIVWKSVPRFGNVAVQANMELVLQSTGTIFLRYGATMSTPVMTSIVGISGGQGAPASALDWSTVLPATINAGTGYETFLGNGFDLANSTIQLQPLTSAANSHSGAFASMSTCTTTSYPQLAGDPLPYGAGCPTQSISAPSAIYELFTPTGGANPTDLSLRSIQFTRAGNVYTTQQGPGLDTSYLVLGTAVPMSDEVMVRNLTAGPMGSFPFGSLAVTSFGASDNGYLDLQGNIASEFQPLVNDMLGVNGEGARIAPHWSDYDLSAAGAFYWSNNDPSFCMATWDGVPGYSQPGTSSTFQAKMFANGDIVFSYGSVSSLFDDVIAGISMGNNAVDPRPTDLSQAIVAAVVRNLGNLTLPLSHRALGRPSINTTFTLTATNVPPGGTLGLFVLSGVQANSPISPSAPGCTIYVGLDDTYVAVLNGTSTFEQPLAIPPVPAFVGVTIYTQAAVFAPANPFGVVSSNGLAWTIGL